MSPTKDIKTKFGTLICAWYNHACKKSWRRLKGSEFMGSNLVFSL